MPTSEQWNWVFLAYVFTYLVLVVFVASLAVRINAARRRLGADE